MLDHARDGAFTWDSQMTTEGAFTMIVNNTDD